MKTVFICLAVPRILYFIMLFQRKYFYAVKILEIKLVEANMRGFGVFFLAWLGLCYALKEKMESF